MKESKENRVPFDLIAAMLSSEASSQQISDLDEWIAQSEKNQKIVSEYSNLWHKSGSINPADSSDVNSEWAKFLSERSDNKKTDPQYSSIYLFRNIAVAACIIVLLGLTGILSYNSFKFENVVAGTNLEIINLPDGSIATLYPGSRIKYPKKFKGQSRPVKLEGEAFFNVIRDSLRTFSVSSSEMIIKVLGTSFNVEAYHSNKIFNVVVEEGKVAVSNKKEGKTEYLLSGQKASFNREEKEIALTLNKDINFNAWRTREIVFDNSNLEEVASTLSKAYFTDIQVTSKAKDQNISVSFADKTLDYILKTIEATLEVDIVKENDRILIK
jgi:transmembrane sensor